MPYDKSINFDTTKTSVITPSAAFITPSRFKLIIDSYKYPNTEFTVTNVEMPNVSATPSVINGRQRNMPGMPDKIEYGELNITFLINENMTNYLEMHDWIFGLVKEVDDRKKTRDLTLIVLNSNNNPVRTIRFIDAFPTNLAGSTFDVTASDATYLTSTVTFVYSYYTID